MEDNIILEGQITVEEALGMTNSVVVEEIKVDEFKIEDLSSATWCFKKIKDNNDKIKEIKAVAEEQINSIKEWVEKEIKSYDNTFLEFKLQEYFKSQRDQDKKFKLSTPYGAVTSRKTTKYNYVDEELVLNYLKENHSAALRIKEEIDKNEFKKIYKDGVNYETGEVIPGVEIETVENFNIKTK